jgi:hypothetical protein
MTSHNEQLCNRAGAVVYEGVAGTCFLVLSAVLCHWGRCCRCVWLGCGVMYTVLLIVMSMLASVSALCYDSMNLQAWCATAYCVGAQVNCIGNTSMQTLCRRVVGWQVYHRARAVGAQTQC